MINGSYVFIKNGEEVARSNNILTTLGKDLIIKYISGSISNWGDSLAVGIGYDGSTAATVSDSTLAFEISRNLVALRSPSISTVTTTITGSSAAYTITVGSNTGLVVGMALSGTGISTNAVITNIASTTITLSHANTGAVSGNGIFTLRKILFKTSLSPNIVSTINEVGLVSFNSRSTSVNPYDIKILTRFDEGINVSGGTDTTIWSYSAAASSSSTNSKVGLNNIIVNNSSTILGSTTTSPTTPGTLNYDISGFNRTDTIQLALIGAAASTTGTVTITLYDSQSTPAVLTWSIGSDTYTNTSTKVKTSLLSALTATSGTFNNVITAIKIATTANISFDAIKIEDTSAISTEYGLVSRSVLSSPITKNAGDTLDIQYELNLGL
jgi:hypothetical protein